MWIFPTSYFTPEEAHLPAEVEENAEPAAPAPQDDAPAPTTVGFDINFWD
jgi:hypothetical protein